MKIITEEKISSVINKAIALGLDVCSKLGNKTKKDTALPTATALKDAEGNPIIDGEGNQVYDYNGDLYYLGCEKNKSITIVNVHPFRISNIVNNLSSYDDPSTDIVTDPVDDTNYQDIESCDITWTGGTPPFKIQLVTDIYNNLVSEVITPIITTPLDTTTVININPKLLTSTGDSSLNARTYNLSKLDPTDTWYGNDLDIDVGNTNHQKYIGLLITDSLLVTPATDTTPAVYRTLFVPFTPDQTDVLNKEYNLPKTYKHYGPYSFGLPRVRELTPLSTSLNITYGKRITLTLYNLAVYVPGTYGVENTILPGTYTYKYYNPDKEHLTNVINVLFNAYDNEGTIPNIVTSQVNFTATDTTYYHPAKDLISDITINKNAPALYPVAITRYYTYGDITWGDLKNTFQFINSNYTVPTLATPSGTIAYGIENHSQTSTIGVDSDLIPADDSFLFDLQFYTNELNYTDSDLEQVPISVAKKQLTVSDYAVNLSPANYPDDHNSGYTALGLASTNHCASTPTFYVSWYGPVSAGADSYSVGTPYVYFGNVPNQLYVTQIGDSNNLGVTKLFLGCIKNTYNKLIGQFSYPTEIDMRTYYYWTSPTVQVQGVSDETLVLSTNLKVYVRWGWWNTANTNTNCTMAVAAAACGLSEVNIYNCISDRLGNRSASAASPYVHIFHAEYFYIN